MMDSAPPLPDSSAATADLPAGRQRKPWPKIHLIYYLLASLDVVAIVASLILGHRGIQTYEAGIAVNSALDRQLVSIRIVADAATDGQAVVISSLNSGDINYSRRSFETKMAEYRRELLRLKQQAKSDLDEQALPRFNRLLAALGLGINSFEAHALAVMDNLAAGDRDKALAEMSIMQARYVTLRSAMRDSNQFLGLLKTGGAQRDIAKVQHLRTSEWAIGALILLIIGCVIAYGHFIGRLMKLKYRDLEDTHDALEQSHARALAFTRQIQAVNDDVTTLNVKLASNMRQMREMQEDSIRKGKMAQLGQLTATVAHELRNPLGAVRTSVFLLERKLQGANHQIAPQIERINSGITRCDGIISQLIEFASTSALHSVSVDMDAWLAKLLAEEAEKLPSTVAIDFTPGLQGREIAFDESKFRGVVINLLSNASEALAGKRGDRNKSATAEPLIRVSTTLSQRGAELTIADNGPGIPLDIQDKIREPLFTTKSFGTGLGLPAVEKILQEHEGGLDLLSVPGEGAAFTAWIPLTRQTARAA